MFDISQLRLLAKTSNSGLHEVENSQNCKRKSTLHSNIFQVKDGKVHVALQPGFLNNPDVGIKICLNSKLHQNLPE